MIEEKTRNNSIIKNESLVELQDAVEKRTESTFRYPINWNDAFKISHNKIYVTISNCNNDYHKNILKNSKQIFRIY